MKFQNVYSLFREQTKKYGDAAVFFSRVNNEWVSRSWKEFEDSVHNLACGLLAKGLTHGASVSILAGNIPEWTMIDIAAIAAGGVGVGIYPTSSPEQCDYIIDHSDAEFVFVDTVTQLEKLKALKLSKVKEIFLIEPSVVKGERLSSYDDLIGLGAKNRDEYFPRVEHIGSNARPEDIAIMVYTSGTTGEPKGAMLSHAYILNSVESLRRSVPIFETDISFSYLPGCHVAERISGIYNRLYNGTPAYFVDDLSRLYEYMLEVKPTVFASLPRFFEKIHASLLSGSESAITAFPAQKVKDAFGGNIRLLTSGGAPLPAEIAQFFLDAGLPILQAYGLTENICVAFNTEQNLRFGTVGRPMPMCEVRIASGGEIQVKSPMIFSGYYKQPDKTAEMFTDDGWLKTGDIGEVDDDGFLKITGRIKEIIILSSGKNVSPALVENLVKESHIISHCFLHGDGHSYCVALITINAAEAAHLSPDELASRIQEAVDRANERVSNSEKIRRYEILDRDLSADRDEITPTMKLKRNIVALNFKEVLEKLYEN